MGKKTGSLACWIFTLCAACFCAVTLFQNAAAALHGSWAVVLASALAAFGVGALCLRAPHPLGRFSLLLFAVRFTLAVCFILWLKSQPVQDFKTMYDAAAQLAGGSHAYLKNPYFSRWAYQSAFVAYEALIIRLFGASLLPLQLLNAAYLAGINVLVYRIARCFLPEKAAMAAGAMYALYPAPLFLAGVLTNQHLSVFLLYAAVYVLVSRNRLTPLRGALAGTLMALGNAVRPIGIILLLAALIWCVPRALGRSDGRALLSGACAAACYFLAGAALSGLIVFSGVNPHGLANRQPMWKFAVGLNQQSNGMWNKEDYEAFLSLPDEQADRALRGAVQNRLSVGPAKLASLAWRKSAAMWAGNEDLYWGFGHLTPSDPAPLGLSWNTIQLALGHWDHGIYLAAFALALFKLLTRLREKAAYDGGLMLTVLLCLYYGVHLIVEVQPRYRYFLMPCVFLLAAAALERFAARKRS